MEEYRADRDVVAIESRTASIIDRANSLVVQDEPAQKIATDSLSYIKQAYRTLETKRKFFVQPLNDHVKQINNFFKGMTDLVFLDNAVKSRQQDDHHQANQPHCGPVHGQGKHQYGCDKRLHNQARGMPARTLFFLVMLKLFQHFSYR